MSETPRVSVVTTGWNHSYLLKDFIRSFERVVSRESASRAEMIVVNNASVDDTASFLDAWQDSARGARFKRVIHADFNLGFAGGNNLALMAARGEHILLLNNDVVFEADPIAYCFRHYARTPRAILGRKLVRRAGRWNRLNGHTVRYLEGWCLFASAAICREIGFWKEGAYLGLFDETFSPAFFEDVDLSLRARLRGIALRQVRVPVRHLGSRTTRMTPSFPYDRIIEENHRRFLAKWQHLRGELAPGRAAGEKRLAAAPVAAG
jgi:GT2 family glycosyltransferase